MEDVPEVGLAEMFGTRDVDRRRGRLEGHVLPAAATAGRQRVEAHPGLRLCGTPQRPQRV